MEITHLVVNGCSYTYCQGLENPTTQGWPALVAKYLGCEVVNLAIKGTGNDTIHRRTYEYVIENLPKNSKPFFIIAWTQYWRREFWWKNWYNSYHNEYAFIPKPLDKINNDYERALLDNWSEEEILRKTMLLKLSLKSLLELHNYPYIMTDYHEELLDQTVINNVIKKFPNFYDTFLKINDFKNLRETTLNTPVTPCQHTGVEGQQKVAEKMIDEIVKKYQNINTVVGNFLKLKDMSYHKMSHPNNYFESCWK